MARPKPITPERAATLVANAGADFRTAARWKRTSCGACFLKYDVAVDRWVMFTTGDNHQRHSIAGGDLDRLNAHWRGFCETNNANTERLS